MGYRIQNTKIQAQIDQFEEKNRKEERIRLEEILYDHAGGVTKTNLRSRQNALLDFIKLEHDERRDTYGINMAHSFLRNLDMSRSRLQDKGIEGILKSASFLRADLENAKFFDAHLEEALFLETNLKGGWFRNAHLEGAHFRGAFLGDVDFSGADLTGTHFDMAIVDSPDWIERLHKIQPPVKGFDFSLWSITEVKFNDGNSVFLITAPKDSKEHNLTMINQKKLMR
ncbi:pentapeptide repeat-containing protein [Gimesia sp.]|uniref:pentapeptide repeat-containing protein n=1 Tax=Gimesia sp. TaxID=2024833 RepID=UPI000C3F20AD|nr:pentapeptide repeat-containing protein [Gimesia sp.]MAX38015.1 hypothetical protein [Gimesia sp.]